MFTKKESSLPDKILSGLLSLLAIEFLTCGIDYAVFSQPLLSSSFLLFNPALFIYISALTKSNFQLRYFHLLHLLPFIGFELYAYIVSEPLALENFFVRDHQLPFRVTFGIANVLSWLIYHPLSLRLVHRHRMHLRNEESTIESNESLGWILFIAIFYVIYCIIAILIAVFIFTGNINPLSPHFFNYATMLCMVYIMSFYGLRQQQLPVRLLNQQSVTAYQHSTMSNDTKQKIAKQLTEYFEDKKPWLNPDFNMDALASAMNIPKYQITEVLNTQLGRNFFQFVNHYRVEAVRNMLTDPRNNYSIEAIGYECGFASKSAFYTVFKKITRMTPVEYRNRCSELKV